MSNTAFEIGVDRLSKLKGGPQAIEDLIELAKEGQFAECPGHEQVLELGKALIQVDAELAHRGYTMHTVTPTSWTATYRIVDDALAETSPVNTFQTYAVDAGTVAVRVGA